MSEQVVKTQPGAEVVEESLEIDSRSYWADALVRFRRNKMAVFCTFLLLAIIIFVNVVPYLIPYDYSDIDWDNIASPPSSLHWLGTDENGRDILSRIAFGGRISFLIGFSVAFFSLIIGIAYGVAAGYFGGWVDSVMMRTIEVLDSLPSLFIIILVTVLFGNSVTILVMVMALTGWYGKARLLRGMTLSIKRREFVEAAHVIGVPTYKILFRHLVPNLMSTIIIYLSFSIPGAISTESGLSYLGLGIQEPLASWGSLISDGSQVMQTAPWLLFFPSLFLSVTIFNFTFIGDGLRDAFDPKDR